MSDETPEINSAEQEAEDILKEAFANAVLDGEDCPQGEACAIHHRNDEEILDDDAEFGRIVSYVGEYAVVTTDNPQLENPVLLIRIILGQVKDADLPDTYETSVIHVGEGALFDVRNLDKDGRRESIRFIQTHSKRDNFKDAHNVVVNGLKEGLIDVSKSAYPKED